MTTSRRKFVTTVATTGAGLAIVPRHVLGRGFIPPSDRLNIAGVGVGGMGRSNLFNLAPQNNIVALCDADWGYAGRSWDSLDADVKRQQERLATITAEPARSRAIERLESLKRLIAEDVPRMTRYTDYREMLDKQKDIDAVVVATPDHLHAVVASAAMDQGKHVYVQKPLCWSVQEARSLAQKAKANPKLVTQMGNQGHSWDDGRKAVEWIQAGAIGDVREVHIWTNRPLAYWPQGIPRPDPNAQFDEKRWNMSAVMARLARALGSYPVPDKLSWDLFLGPAPMIEYHPVYHPFNWRGWVDWGVGAIGDMGAHLIDHSFWALDLGMPTSVETISTPFNKACYPMATTTYYEFPARGSRPAVKLTWYDGGLKPGKPEELVADPDVTSGRVSLGGAPARTGPATAELNEEGGALFIGSKGKLMHETYGLNPRILPKSLEESTGAPQPKLPRIATTHELNWADACKGKGQASTPIEYAARLTEVMLLGVVALRAGTKIYYDAANMRITNAAAANDFLRREYRQGWSL